MEGAICTRHSSLRVHHHTPVLSAGAAAARQLQLGAITKLQCSLSLLSWKAAKPVSHVVPKPIHSSTKMLLRNVSALCGVECGVEEFGVGVGQDTDNINTELRSTQMLVECAMFSAITGLAYFLSNSLRIENYFGCFFPLPLLVSSMRWGVSACRKTMVSTAILLLVLSGPLKAISYLLMHGFLGFSMGILWRLEINWMLSVIICSLVRSVGAVGTVLLSSWLLRENILYLIMINTHASLSYILSAIGVNMILPVVLIYTIFTILVILNCGSLVFLLHVLYAIFLKRLGMSTTILLPGWLKRAI